MTRRLSILALLGAAAFGVAGCGGKQTPEKNLKTERAHSGPPDFHFDQTFLDVLEFEQGRSASYDLVTGTHVPQPGDPVLSIEGLPEGATFNGTTLTWLPPCGENPEFYLRDYGVATPVLTLSSSESPEEYVQRRVVLLVHKFKEYDDRKCGA